MNPAVERPTQQDLEDTCTVPPLLRTPRRDAIAQLLRNKPTIRGPLIALVLLVLAVMIAPHFAPQNPYDLGGISVLDNNLPPFAQGMDGHRYLLGSDGQGRDMLSAILYGMRISLIVGLSSVAIASLIGSIAGLLAAYLGGFVDAVVMRLVDFVLGFPSILVALVLLATTGRGIDKVIIALVLVQWASYARIIRGRALQERKKEYVEAATNLGYSPWRVMCFHLLPNSVSPILVYGTVQIAHAIVLEATLSFLGVGVPITEPSLGLLIANGFQYLLSGDYWNSIFPGVALVFLIFAINLIGDRLRDGLEAYRI